MWLVQLPVPLPHLLPLVRCLNGMVFAAARQDVALLLEASLPAAAESRQGGEGEAGAVARSLRLDTLRCGARCHVCLPAFLPACV
jgi:hypothetical protein